VVSPAADAKVRPLPRPAEEASSVLSRVFGGQNLADGADSLGLHIAHIVDEGIPAALEVELSWPGRPRRPGARLYVIADENRVPLLARIELGPDPEPGHVSLDVRLDASTHLRVVLAFDDGTLLQVARWVWVLPRDLAIPGPERRSR
jgi:predicted secreted protein